MIYNEPNFCKLVPESYFPKHQAILLFVFDLFTPATELFVTIKISLVISSNQLLTEEFARLYVTRTDLLMGELDHTTTPTSHCSTYVYYDVNKEKSNLFLTKNEEA